LLDKVRIQFVLDGGYAGKQFYYPDSDDITVMMGGKLVAIEEKIKMI
jgi:hypothetical protein